MAEKTVSRPMSRAEIEQKIVALAWTDDAFRRAFLADPKGEFERRLGRKLPAGLVVSAHEEDVDKLHFVIPVAPKGITELSDTDLERVAGGVDVVSTLLISAAGVLAAGASAGGSILLAQETKWDGKVA